MGCEHSFALPRIHDLVHQPQTGHGVLRVTDCVAVSRRDFVHGKPLRKRRAAHQHRHADPGFFEITRGQHHLLRALHQQTRQADSVRLMFPEGLNELLGSNLNPEVDYVISVVTQDDLDQVLADVMHVALHGGENDLAARAGIGLFHERLKVVDRSFHGLGRLQHFGNDQLIRVKEASHLGHTGHQRAVDDIERGHAFFQLEIQIGDQAFLRAFDDVISQALIQRKVGCLCLLLLRASAEEFGDFRDMELIDRRFLLGASARASPPAPGSPPAGC